MGELNRTPLFQVYGEHDAKLVDFGGWEMPVQFSNIIEEHHKVRDQAGLFDVSHMGEIMIEGDEAENLVQYLVTNNVKKIIDNQVQYTLMCYPEGGVVDDLLIYRYNSERYMLVVNASNVEKDYHWIVEHSQDFDAEVTNISADKVQLALQGPVAEEILQELTDFDLGSIKFFHFAETKLDGIEALVSRTGYTGEDGFEIYLAQEDGVEVWNKIFETGGERVEPIGLGARNTLRFEAVLPLYGHEISKDITPLEAGLSFFVKLETEDDFIGKEALMKQKAEGLERKLVGFEMIDRGIPRANFTIIKDDEEIGFVTTGSYAPTLDKNIGLALVKTEFIEHDTEFEVKRGRRTMKAKVIKKPFYRKNYKK